MVAPNRLLLPLNPNHLRDLESSGLTRDQIALVGHFSASKQQAQDLVGYSLTGLIFAYCDLNKEPYQCNDGKPFYRIKPDWGKLKTEDSPKYLSPSGQGNRPYFSRLIGDWNLVAKRTNIDLTEVEGEKKADCLCSYGEVTIGFSGVFGWLDRTPRPGEGKLEDSRTLPELDAIEWRNREVYQCFDSDITEKLAVKEALFQRALDLQKKGARPYLLLLPNEIDGSKNGPDDFVARHGIEAFRVLKRAAQPSIIWTGKGKDKQPILNLFEPTSHYKALMAWSVLKEKWAFRPGIGWYEWQSFCWKQRTLEEFEAVLTQFMDGQNWAERGNGLICSIVRELRSRLLVRDEAWSPVDKLAFHNGTLLLITGEFTATHNPLDRITKVRPYNFDRSAQCPTWLRFLNQATGGDLQLIKLLQAWVRYGVLPKPKDRKAEIEKSLDLFGLKGTGKGTFLEVLILLVGSENVGPASPETFKSAVGLGQLIDKDLAVDADSSGFLGNIGAYNKVVSNELVEVKKLYRDSCTMRLGVAVVRAYNAFISVPDAAEGLDRRLTVVPFRHQPQTIDIELGKKLQAELSGIFTWAWSLSPIEMKRRILLAGSINIVAEASIERFEANNPEFRFLSEIFPHGRESIKASDLYQFYKTWCRDNEHQPKSQVKFRPAVEVLGAKRSAGKINGCYYYDIPRMADFDVAAHLGIVGRQFETVGDSFQDSSNPDYTRRRDSSRQLETKSFLADTNQLPKQEISLDDSLAAQLSTTIPNQVAEGDTSVSKSLPTILHSTESIPNLSPEPASNLSKPLNPIEARATTQPQQLTTAKSEPIEGRQMLPNTDNKFEILNRELVVAQDVSESKAPLTEQKLAPDEPLKVGDRVIWINSPSSCEFLNPVEITSIDKDYARLSYVYHPVPIADLQRFK